ncbi:hypothetical protein NS365_17795 [Aureimonas ureilytica]|uniref:DUF3617 family protein n=1 Tax=Aureimonas ureilytica TaxID=401562 RepID=A0A175RIW4_9HYPH|nr:MULTISPECIES: DUF3617 family protein [Aureimonas]KTR03715.1 hypothetical protein NS365_17795 [Aureimonas ureilytica]
MRVRVLTVCLAATIGTMGTAFAAETLPMRKAGLWETKTQSPDGNVTVRQCIDEKTDQLAQGAFGASQNCSKRSLVKTDTGYESESECKIGTISATGKALISGDFDSKIHMKVDTTLTGVPDMKEPVRRQMEIDATYVGPCIAGQSPGDIIMPDGKIVKMPTAPKP